MNSASFTFALGVSLSLAATTEVAFAQRSAENAAASSDDAFGTLVGSEITGIYSEIDTRGLSPLKAGNARLDGIYFDQVASLSGRTRTSYGIRVGIAAIDYPFAAPTGIVDNRLRTAGDSLIASVALTKLPNNGYLAEIDAQIPIIKDRLSTYLGAGHAHTISGDGGLIPSVAFSVKPVVRPGSGIEISPFYARTVLYNVHNRLFFLTSGSLIPPQPERGRYLGQDWAKSRTVSSTSGITLRAPLARGLALRAGLFRSSMSRVRNYTEFFSFSGPGTTVRHRMISDPKQDTISWSGEAQLAWKLGGGTSLQHRLIGGFRARRRFTESGGSDLRDFGLMDLYGEDPEPEPVFTYGQVNQGRVRQQAWLLGYQAKLADVGSVNLGLQRARYRATFLDATSGLTSNSKDDAWLYNASFALKLAKGIELFAGTQKGLEDSGAAPENAVNRNEQLPTTRSTQYEGGMRLELSKRSQLVLSGFQIKRPYFTFDGTGRFTEQGQARYRGAEISLTGHFDRLTLLAGAVAMKPAVSGPAVAAGLVGSRPVGLPDYYARVDVQYRTGILSGLTPTATLTAVGPRAMGATPLASLGGKQAEVGSYTTLDLGLRHRFRLGEVPASLRFQLQNIFNKSGWKVVNSNTLQVEEQRRVAIYLTADF